VITFCLLIRVGGFSLPAKADARYYPVSTLTKTIKKFPRFLLSKINTQMTQKGSSGMWVDEGGSKNLGPGYESHDRCLKYARHDGLIVAVRQREEPRASANGRRWSARGFFQRKSHYDLKANVVQNYAAIHPCSPERGILAFSRERLTALISYIPLFV
jgi:hypothetical protein